MTFNEDVYAICKKVPKGKVTTYGEIAKALNSKAYQAIGNAMHNNPYAPIVPCHRVVNSDGRLGGFAHGPKRKTAMLKKEGVKVKDGNIVDFDRVLHKF